MPETIKSTIITHNDLDGVVSGALMLKHLERQDRDIHFFSHYYTLDLLERICEDQELSSKNLIVQDMAFTSKIRQYVSSEGDSLIRRLLTTAKSSTWIDHHKETLTGSKILNSYGTEVIDSLGEKICTSALVYQHFLGDDPYANWISHLAQLDDYKGTESTQKNRLISQQLAKIVALHNSNRDNTALEILAKRLGKKDCWFDNGKLSKDLVTSLELHAIREKRGLQYLEQNLEQYQIQGHNVIISYADPILPEKETIEKMPEFTKGKNDQIYALVFGNPINNIWLLYKGKGKKIDLEDFLDSQNGGGRIYLGGMPPTQVTDKNNYQQEKELFFDRLNDYLSSERHRKAVNKLKKQNQNFSA